MGFIFEFFFIFILTQDKNKKSLSIRQQEGKYLDLNQEQIEPHAITLPIELYLPSERVIRTHIDKYQKFMTYPLVNLRV